MTQTDLGCTLVSYRSTTPKHYPIANRLTRMIPGTTDAALSPNVPLLKNPDQACPITPRRVCINGRGSGTKGGYLATATLYSYFATATGDRLKLNDRAGPLNSERNTAVPLNRHFRSAWDDP